MDLKGKTAIVTGGNRGIGRAIVEALSEKGANCAVVYRSGVKEAEASAEAARRKGVEVRIYQTDVADRRQVRLLVDTVRKDFGGIDVLINNAGVSSADHAIDRLTDEEWDRVLQTNLTGAFYCIQESLDDLRSAGGVVVSTSSIAGKMGGTIGSNYAASKAGLIGLTFALATELAPDVRLNAVAPGPVDTDLISPEVKKKLSSMNPFGRIAKPEEIAHTVIYLAENDYVTGEVVDVNAGRYMD
ncbi:MAG: 3-oxoacyl-ACP reductase FabG [Spirochaetales bacterium]|nr:3-oxoacyl-ACP reductase FabG [Spirochaetales bacterium]MCF7937816.1 3-oxoacyl-ACP reductase FabG [Spirochaetales bacterium]